MNLIKLRSFAHSNVVHNTHITAKYSYVQTKYIEFFWETKNFEENKAHVNRTFELKNLAKFS